MNSHATLSTHSISAALQRIEKTVQIQNPSNFTFSLDQSLELIENLQKSAKVKDVANLIVRVNINFRENVELDELYFPIVDKFLNINPPLAPFKPLLLSKEIISMLHFTTWIVIFDIIDNDIYPNDMDDTRRVIYDRLSIEFSQIQMKLSNSTISLSDRFIELWSAVVCASIFTILLTLYQDSELYRSVAFSLRVENDVRLLLVGFASPNVKDYHRSILSLMPNDLKLAVPTIVTVGGEDYSTELTTALTYEPQIAAAWVRRKDTLFEASATTGLMQNAMKLKGTKIAVPKHQRKVKKGNVEKSGLPIAKARIVIKNTEVIINNYKDDRRKAVIDLCATEETYTEVPNVPPITTLGVSFEGFEQNQQQKNKPKSSKSSSFERRSPRNLRRKTTENTAKTTAALPKSARAPRKERPPGCPRFKYRKVPDIPEIMSTIQNVHDDLTNNPIFIL